MVAIPFCGQSYTDRTLNANAQSCINFYPTRSPTAQDPNRMVLYPTPGYLLFNNLVPSYNAHRNRRPITGSEIRGMLVINDTLYIVAGDAFLFGNSLTTLQNAVTNATNFWLNTSTGKVSITWNTVEILISDGKYGYVYNIAANTFTVINGGGWPASGGVTNFTYQDGYIVAAVNNSKTVIQSNLLAGGVYDAQAQVSLTSFPDNLVAVFSDELQLYLFGPKVTEVRFDAGTIPFAFAKVQGVLVQAGCAAVHSVIKAGTTLMWLANDAAGSPYITALEGYSPRVLSTPPINEAIARYETVSDCFAYTYREGASQFAVFTFPTAEKTWAFDLNLNQWHERQYDGGADLPTAYATWQGNHIVGDAAGNLWYMSQTYSDARWLDTTGDDTTGNQYVPGNNVPAHYPPARTRVVPHIEADGKILMLHELEIFYEPGAGSTYQQTSPDTSGLATAIRDPQATLFISKDRGHTWINVGTRKMGMIGQYKQRLVWRNLGKGRAITPKLVITDPARSYIIGADVRISVASK